VEEKDENGKGRGRVEEERKVRNGRGNMFL